MYQTAVADAGRSNFYRLYNITGDQHIDPTVLVDLASRHQFRS